MSATRPDGTPVPDSGLSLIDGRDALAIVLVRPGPDGQGVTIEAAANGIDKPTAALVLRHIAQQWDPQP